MKAQWLKDGIRESRKVNKKMWNRKVRRYSKILSNGCEYKKLAGVTIYDRVV